MNHYLSFTVTGMHCNSCGLLIDDAVEDLPGVLKSVTDVRSGTCRVELAENSVTGAGEVAAAIEAEGYAAVPA